MRILFRTFLTLSLIMTVLMLLQGCGDTETPATDDCTIDGECDSGQVCRNGSCIPGEVEADTDQDGLQDLYEQGICTDYEVADTDGDGEDDAAEVGDITAPTDTDGDGIIDACESSVEDTDADGVVDELDECNDIPNPCDCTPEEELCDGADNDCDGDVDEDEAGEPLSRSCGISEDGECQFGVEMCADGSWSECVDAMEPVAELCDGLDNDCDGEIDNGYELDVECSVGIGECTASGVMVCAEDGSQSTCDAAVGEAVDEICDGLDNDCDGSIDEELINCCIPGQDQECGIGTGICTEGTQVCTEDFEFGECLDDSGDPIVTAEDFELCNELDDNCNGEADEEFNVGEPCVSGRGQCEVEGVYICSEDGESTFCDAESEEPGEEICDGVDNDCDGNIDRDEDGNTLSLICGSPIGECEEGIQACEDGVWSDCRGSNEASDELCDELDNDCDDETDEDFPLGEVCTAGVGACESDGVMVCTGNQLGVECSAEPGSPQIEICNGIDDNCNGSVDENVPQCCEPNDTMDCGSSTGTCTAGIQTCDSERNWGACFDESGQPVVQAQTEICNGEDDDCDGDVDETFALSVPCEQGRGECRASGVTVCNEHGTSVVCGAELGEAEDEICDGLDNDCDGAVDEGVTEECGDDIGACRHGLRYCMNGVFGPCLGATEPSEETCNGVDDDCNGDTDENFPLGESCEAGVGACVNEGNTICAPNHVDVVCDARPGTPSDELCDGIDNNCDGSADEVFRIGEPCVVGQGACQAEGEFVCDNETESTCSAVPGDPQEEICNGIDDNCDGQIDEDVPQCCDPGDERECGMDVGACTSGTQVCSSRREWRPCLDGEGNPIVTQSDDICDGVDNDCDGQADEDYNLGQGCLVGIGACRARGTTVCTEDRDDVMCNAEEGEPAPETCDNIDNDCDGDPDMTDGEFLFRDCYSGPDGTAGVGQCEAGLQMCSEGWWSECEGEILPVREECNGIDNDCDGEADMFGDESIMVECYTGPEETLNVGECYSGFSICMDGEFSECLEEVIPQEEVCDGLDNDCDGDADEEVSSCCSPGDTRECGTNEGACQAGIQICTNEREWNIECQGEIPPVEEICEDNVDNNCDGEVNEGCTGGCETTVPISFEVGHQQFTGNNSSSPDNQHGSCHRAGGHEVIFELVLEQYSRVIFETLHPEANRYDTTLYIRSDCSNPETEIACNDDGGDSTLSRIERDMEPGTYYIILDGYSSTSVGDYLLDVWINPHNTCDQPRVIDIPAPGESTIVYGNTTGSSNDFESTCAGNARSPDHVWNFTLERNTQVTLETLDMEGRYDTALHLRSACDDAETQIACDDDGGYSTLSKIETHLEAGTYYVIVDGFSSGRQGPYTLELSTGSCENVSYTVYGTESITLDYNNGQAWRDNIIRAFNDDRYDIYSWVGFDMSNIPDSLEVSAVTLNLRHYNGYRNPQNNPIMNVVNSEANLWNREEAAIEALVVGHAVSGEFTEFAIDDWNAFPLEANAPNWHADLADNWLTLGINNVDEEARWVYFHGTDDTNTRPNLLIEGVLCQQSDN